MPVLQTLSKIFRLGGDEQKQEAADEFRGDDQGIQPEREIQTGTQMLK